MLATNFNDWGSNEQRYRAFHKVSQYPDRSYACGLWISDDVLDLQDLKSRGCDAKRTRFLSWRLGFWSFSFSRWTEDFPWDREQYGLNEVVDFLVRVCQIYDRIELDVGPDTKEAGFLEDQEEFGDGCSGAYKVGIVGSWSLR